MNTEHPNPQMPPVKTWASLEEYIEDNPEAEQFYRPLRMGHFINKGHKWEAQIHLAPNGTIYFTRECC